MKRSSMLMTLCLLVILSAALHLWQKKYGSADRGTLEKVRDAVSKSTPKNVQNMPEKAASGSAVVSRAQQNTKAAENSIDNSLNNMTATLFAFAQSHNDINALLEYLKSSHQDPFVVDDSNEATGTMTIVRTNSPLPGTRYFHAQYFEDENRQKFVQHMSFEFKPGSRAMQEAIASVEKNFNGLGQPTAQTADFIQWSLQDGYVLWIKKLNSRDLADNPFNAYTQNDVGTIRIAIEQNPEEGHSHGG